MYAHQTTLAGTVALSGVGVHSGAPVSLTLDPADAGTGVVFVRVMPNGDEREIPASHALVNGTELQTVLGDPSGASVSTTEHLLAAIRALGLDNVRITVDGPELPIVDGSSRPFVEAIESVGLQAQAAPRRLMKILKPVRVEQGRGFAELAPAPQGFHLDVEIDFASDLIGRQRIALDLTPGSFRTELAGARTFGFLKDVERLWAAGFARGSSTDNTIVLGEDRVLNPEGLRFADEFVRHKALDAVGDLALSGAPLVGRFRSFCGGHRLNGAVLGALLADPAAYAIVDAEAPARRERGDARRPALVANPAAAFGHRAA
ncbi:UDP-3-O-acyl-N-acetylglucosamine deacetylase [Methylopila turkensis]|uniref:UDP-3-O-acyl-N-acetylglucosamine deacetylase n=1 Tax=Methylopila turkensis TaxID=1437816 RepID=A0A9W6N8G9_9HYPH|nr:UDP-3-O-acyl-N-acetylglucosamine deacetylase [Methylopila turkensis]GLK81371.1 UDP-3-O-acyl-N-acetylglucosamine deacetylase [Methylopila turkensis]